MSKWREGRGYGLFLEEDGRVSLRINDHRVVAEFPVRDRAWHFIAATYDAASGTATLYHEPQIRYALDPSPRSVERFVGESIQHDESPFVIAGRADRLDSGRRGVSHQPMGWIVGDHYNGKIDSPRVCNRALSRLEIEQMKLGGAPGMDEGRSLGPSGALGAALVAAWDFSEGISGCRIIDQGPYRLNGELVGLPARGMTGHNWSGRETDWRRAPGEYGAIHFHDDDVDDARWDVDFTMDVPSDLPSAVYAMKLTAGEDDEYYVPFFVKPPVGAFNAKIAVIMSTTDYMAYANEHLGTNAGAAELLF